MAQARCDQERATPSAGTGTPASPVFCGIVGDDGSSFVGKPFEFPVSAFPVASVVMSQYAMHTHLVLSVDRSLGEVAGVPVHESLPFLEEAIEREISNVREGALADELGELLVKARVESRRQHVLLRKVRATPQRREKICLLYNALGDNESDLVNNAAIYNALLHVSGMVFTDRPSIAAHLKTICTDRSCSCSGKLGSAGAASAAKSGPPALKLTTPRVAGPEVEALHNALAGDGLSVDEAEVRGMEFGPSTEKAVRNLQNINSLAVDGIVGPETRQVLGL